MLKLTCATKCSNNHMHPQIHSQDSLHFTITLAVMRGAALPHLKRGTTALVSWHKEVSAHADFSGWLNGQATSVLSVDLKNPTMEEMRIIHLNGQATSVYIVSWMVMSTIE